MPAPSRPIGGLARAVAWLFYRVERIGSRVPDGPILLLPNHPNSLLDPAVVWATAGRNVRFVAKSTLFHGHILSPLIRRSGSIPVYRRMDEGVDVSRNIETFAAVHDALARGEAVCLFPEGISHSAGRLAPLRTGAARIALAAAAEGVRVAIVAVGLNFDRQTAFRSRATVAYGPPFHAGDLVEIWRRDAPAAVRLLTARIAGHIRDVIVEADPQTDAELVVRIDRLYTAARPDRARALERVQRRRLIARGIERLRTADPERYAAIYERFRAYDTRLRRFRLRDRLLDWTVPRGTAVRFVLRELLLAIVLLPVVLAGFAVFAAPYWITDAVARRSPTTDVAGTVKAVAGSVLHGTWILLLVVLVAGAAGWRLGLLTLLGLPALAVAALLATERQTAVLETVRAYLAIRRTRPVVRRRLRQARSELAEVLEEVYRWIRENAEGGLRNAESGGTRTRVGVPDAE
jgi:glycerol-3-phosphate O-acyltransferase / dihydroxyacetone phosphate acyltransferase